MFVSCSYQVLLFSTWIGENKAQIAGWYGGEKEKAVSFGLEAAFL
jgi:hypothetical protein